MLCTLDWCPVLYKAACCDPSQQLSGLVQLLLLFLAKQQVANNATHTNLGGIAIGRLYMHLYNASVLTMKSVHLALDNWLFTMSIAPQPAVLAPIPGW